MPAHALFDIQPVQIEGMNMVTDKDRSIWVSMLERDWAPIKANERRSCPNSRRADLKLERHCGINPLLIGNVPKRKVDDRHALDLKRS